jgi:hypothetical protein
VRAGASPVASMMVQLQARASQQLLGLGGSTPLEPRQLQQQQQQAIQLTPLDTPELDAPPTGRTSASVLLRPPTSLSATWPIDPSLELQLQRCHHIAASLQSMRTQ